MLTDPLIASAITINFDTEDDFVTPLINGQVVDDAFDLIDPEFGNWFAVSSNQLGGGSHNDASIFDSDPTGPNSGSLDPDLLVNRGDIMTLQSNNPGSANDTSTDPTYGLIYDNPIDEADFADRGSIIFDFIAPIMMLSVDIVDANGGFAVTVILTDSQLATRTFSVAEKFSGDIAVCGGCDGYQELDLTDLGIQIGEGSAAASGVDSAGLDETDVVSVEFQFVGNPSSGGLATLVFTPEPSTGLLPGLGLVGIAARRRE